MGHRVSRNRKAAGAKCFKNNIFKCFTYEASMEDHFDNCRYFLTGINHFQQWKCCTGVGWKSCVTRWERNNTRCVWMAPVNTFQIFPLTSKSVLDTGCCIINKQALETFLSQLWKWFLEEWVAQKQMERGYWTQSNEAICRKFSRS